MTSLSRELVFLILQFLEEEKFKGTVHRLEQESGFFFNMRYFEELVTGGEWDDAEKYLSGFTKVDDNRYSMKIFFEIRKQKYLEALDKRDRPKAVEILVKDLKVFSEFNEELFKEITHLLTLNDFRKSGKDNLFKCTYVLPDGITHSKGFVKDENEAQRYRSLYDGVPDSHMSEKDDSDVEDNEEKPDNRKKIDLTKNEFNLTNERFLVPEMIFHPADLGMNEAGLAECIVRSVNSCHPLLHPVLYESIILTGGSTLFPHFAKRLERELRPLVPDDYQVKITTQEDPILGVWRGGSLLASSPDFESMCVTKFEYEEEGSARCSKRFFQ